MSHNTTSHNTTPTAHVYQGRQMLEQLQNQPDQLILVDFVGPDCRSCTTLEPVLHQLVSDRNGAIALVKIDITEEPELAIAIGVYSVPTVVVLKQTQVLSTLVGLQSKKRYADTIAQFA